MDLNYTPEENAFRDEVRSYLEENLSPGSPARSRAASASRKPISSSGTTF